MNEYDYSQKGLYFVTICVQNYECLFGDIVEGEMQLTAVGTIADVLWYEIKNHVSSVELHEFVVMPNHIHGIIEITDNVVTAVDAANVVNIVNVNVGARHALPLQPPILTKQQPPQQSRFQNQGKNTLSPIVGSYKSAVTKHAHRLGFDAFSWQRNYHERIIRDVNDYTRIVQYIINNPQKWNNDKYYK
jgi:REP element-mobilizing transposase RayT